MGSYCMGQCQNQKRQSETITLEQQIQQIEYIDDQLNQDSTRNKPSVSCSQLYQDNQQEQEKQDPFSLPLNQQEKYDRLCDYFSQKSLRQLIIDNQTFHQLVSQDQDISEKWQDLTLKDHIWLCYVSIDRMHFNQSEFPMQFRGLLPFAQSLVQLVYKHLESGVKALCITINPIKEEKLGLDIFYFLIRADHILESVMEKRQMEEVWWIKDKSIQFNEKNVKENGQLYTHDIEQQLIKLSGRIKREISMHHIDVRDQFQTQYQKECMFKYRAERTKAKLKTMSEFEQNERTTDQKSGSIKQRHSVQPPPQISLFQEEES